ncbi:MAG: hypothetical protein QF858_02730 [Candidatus Pacebacteria bacterium]|nr:hypothetical protein [Candidatus Paceibacterota bacterium]MDP6659606.1 hypothetical protein [Candidatus Paceibacterota bacterium]
MRKFFGSEKIYPTIALFDIGSGSVGGAIARFSGDDRPTITYSTRKSLPLHKELNPDKLSYHTISALNEVGNELIRKGLEGGEVFGVLCTVSSPWSTVEPATVSAEGVERNITEDYLERILEQGREDIRRNASDDRSGMNLVEETVVRTLADGRELWDLESQRANRVDISMLQGFVSDRFHKQAEDTLERIFGATPIVVQTSILPLFLATRDVYDGLLDFILVDISGEVTDLALVKDGMIAGVASFPIGKHSTARNAAMKSGVHPVDSISNIRLRVNGSDNRLSSMDAVYLLQSAREWGRAFNEACANLAALEPLPNTVLVHADSDTADWFVSQISGSRLAPITKGKSDLVSQYISEDIPGRLCNFEGPNIGYDTGLGVAALYYNRRLLSS